MNCWRSKMQNVTLRIASINHPPYIILNETRDNVWEIVGGVDAYVIDFLKEKFCFKYETVMPVEPAWGSLIKGRWTGVTGMIHRNEVDLGICNMMITESRYESIILSVPYNSDGWLLVSLAPRIFENKHAVFQPFPGEVWCALFVSVLISTCLLFSLQFIRSRFKWTPKLTWRNTLWNVFAILCQEGVKLAKMQGSGLVYFLVWIFSCMVLQTCYSGTLIGFLTFPTMEPSISNLEELAAAVQDNNIQVSYKTYSLAEKLLANHDKYGEIFTESFRKESSSAVSRQIDGFQKVLSGQFVYIGSEFGCTFESYGVDFTKLQMSSILGRNYVAIGYSNKFKYVKDFNKILRRLAERGLIYKWKSDILYRNLIKSLSKKNDSFKKNKEADISTEIALKLTPLSGAFILLTLGHLFGIFSLIAEVLLTKYIQSKRKKLKRSKKWKSNRISLIRTHI